MSKYTYKILKKNKNINFATILKTGMEAKVTISDLARDVQGWTRTKVETFANRGIFKAMMINIERNYPNVKKLKPEELAAYVVYSQKKQQLELAEENLRLLNKNYDSYSKEFKDIKKTLGIKVDTDLDIALAEFKQTKDNAGEIIKKELANAKS